MFGLLVFALGCKKTGVYGNSCNMTCPRNCKDQICNIAHGACFECLPGWMGTLCENSKVFAVGIFRFISNF